MTTIADLEVSADNLDVSRAASIYNEFGCLVVRGLTKGYIEAIAADIERVCDQSVALLDRAEKIPDGWRTPDGTLFIPSPEGYHRDRQLMVIGLNYYTSSPFLQSAFDSQTLDIVEEIIGPNIEIFGNGQSLVKEPSGGHPKLMHQDSGYFEHRYEGPVSILNYVVDTSYENGALHVVPGSHRLGQLKHVDTISHLGLDQDEWPVERGVRIDGKPGDGIFFHVRTIHGSPPNNSDSPRPVFIHRYRRPGDYVVVRGSNEKNRAEAEKHADEVQSASEHGLMVRGFRSCEQ
jgi:phytanoyl-CoA hydroxylase